MRRSYLVVKNLIGQSGWGWDDESKLVTAPPDVWDTYLVVRSDSDCGDRTLMRSQSHPGAKKWRNMPFVHYNEFHMLVEGRHATGERAYRVSSASGNKPDDTTPIEVLDDVDDDDNTPRATNATSQVSQSPYHSTAPLVHDERRPPTSSHPRAPVVNEPYLHRHCHPFRRRSDRECLNVDPQWSKMLQWRSVNFRHPCRPPPPLETPLLPPSEGR